MAGFFLWFERGHDACIIDVDDANASVVAAATAVCDEDEFEACESGIGRIENGSCDDGFGIADILSRVIEESVRRHEDVVTGYEIDRIDVEIDLSRLAVIEVFKEAQALDEGTGMGMDGALLDGHAIDDGHGKEIMVTCDASDGIFSDEVSA